MCEQKINLINIAGVRMWRYRNGLYSFELFHFISFIIEMRKEKGEKATRNNFSTWSILALGLVVYSYYSCERKFSIHYVCKIEWLSDNVITLTVFCMKYKSTSTWSNSFRLIKSWLNERKNHIRERVLWVPSSLSHFCW